MPLQRPSKIQVRNPRLKLSLVICLLFVAVLACNCPGRAAGGPTDEEATQTLQALETSILATSQAQQPTGTPTPDPALSTPTSTPGPSPTIATSPTATELVCDWAKFVSDVTYPDDTEVEVGTTITKTWRLRNIGECTWTTSYSLAFDGGDRMSASNNTPLTSSVAPEAQSDISVELTVPDDPGTYQGFYKLANVSNEKFGIGPTANGSFWIKIEAVDEEVTTGTIRVEAYEDLNVNGEKDDGETPIPNAPAQLGEGTCFSSGLATSNTNSQGVATFAELDPGDYCVRIDHFDIPGGNWDFTSINTVNVNISAGDSEIVTMGFEQL